MSHGIIVIKKAKEAWFGWPPPTPTSGHLVSDLNRCRVLCRHLFVRTVHTYGKMGRPVSCRLLEDQHLVALGKG